MSASLVEPGRRRPFVVRVLDLEHRSRPEQARLVLTATAGLVALGLLIWLLCWIGTDGAVDPVFVSPSGSVGPIPSFQAQDIDRFRLSARAEPAGLTRRLRPRSEEKEEKKEPEGATATEGAPAQPDDPGAQETPYANLKPELERLLARSGSRPVIIYLSAVGISDERSRAHAYLLPTNVDGSLATIDPGSPKLDLVEVDELLTLCDKYESARKLLIVDAGQVGTDRDLGVFANSFTHRLREAIGAKPPKNLVVLTACAPGQISWASEVDRCSVFAHYVAR
ncbi:MAG TPA: hypothetical protein VF590_17715, partial [Isosphaeraceae bacterium]